MLFSETRVSVVEVRVLEHGNAYDVAGAQRIPASCAAGAGQAEQHERSDGAKTRGKLKESFDH